MGAHLLEGRRHGADRTGPLMASLRDLDGEDPYLVLEVEPTADPKSIIAAYRRLIRRTHPDLPGGDVQRARLLNAARDVLLDDDLRAEYDGFGDEQDDAPKSSAWDDEDVFDGPAAPPPGMAGPPESQPPPPQRPTPPPPWPRPNPMSPPGTPYPPRFQYPMHPGWQPSIARYPPVLSPATPRLPHTGMTMAVLSAFFFLPFALPAIVMATQAGSARRSYDYSAAQQAARNSKRWSTAAFIVGVILMITVVCCCGVITKFDSSSTAPPG